MTHVNSGKLKMLGVAAPQRVMALPDEPSFPERGYKNMKSGSWQGIFVPVGTPAPIVNKLFTVFTAVLADPAIGKRLQEIGPHAVLSKSPEEFAAFLKEDTDKWSRLIKEIGVETNWHPDRRRSKTPEQKLNRNCLTSEAVLHIVPSLKGRFQRAYRNKSLMFRKDEIIHPGSGP